MSILISDVINDLAVLPQVCPTDPRLYRFINAAQRKIFLEGNYTGILASYNFLVYTSLITLPYECEAILAADILSTPIYVQNQWFEMLQSGPGYQNPQSNQNPNNNSINATTYPDLFDRGENWCTIQDPPGPFQVQLYCAVPEDPNATVIVEGIDNAGNVVRSQITVPNGDGTVSGEWINGVQSPLYAAGVAFQEPAQTFSRITALSLPKRNGDLRILANVLNPQTLAPTGQAYLLGIYPYFMTNPNFRRYAFPAAKLVPGGSPFKPVPCNTLVRRRPLPVCQPSDRLTVSNIEALKFYVQAAWKEEEEQWDVADRLAAKGKFYLEQETRKTGRGIDRLNVNFRGFGLFPRTPGSLVFLFSTSLWLLSSFGYA